MKRFVLFVLVLLIAESMILSAIDNGYNLVDKFAYYCALEVPSRSILVADEACLEVYQDARAMWGK